MAQETTMTQTTFENTYNQFTPDEFRDPLFGELRVFIDTQGECWFVGYEVAGTLGYSNPRDAISKHVSNKYKISGVAIRDGSSYQNRMSTLIHEEGVYELCMKSQLPEAEPFQEWVRKKIKDLRKYGVAMSQQMQESVGMTPQQLYEENSRLKEALQEAQPAIHMYHQNTQNTATITAQQIADNYGWTAQKMNTILHRLGFHYPSGDGWVLYKKYKDQDLVSTVTRQTNEGLLEFTTGYTEKGRNLVDQILHDNGYKTRYESQDDIDRRIQIANDRANQYNNMNNMYNQQYHQPVNYNTYNNYFFGSNPDETWNQIRQIPDPVARGNAMKAFSNHIHDKAASKGYSNCPLVDKYGNPF